MPEARKFLTADERMRQLEKDRKILRRERMIRDHFDRVLVRPWPGPARLLACLVDELPPSREVQGGYRVVTGERLGRELVGTVGPRADLFVLYEKVEGIETSS